MESRRNILEDVAVEFAAEGGEDDGVIAVGAVDQGAGDGAVGQSLRVDSISIVKSAQVLGLAARRQAVEHQCVVAEANVELGGEFSAFGGGEGPCDFGGDGCRCEQ